MSRDQLPPVLLGEVRALGFPISLSCPVYNHSATVAVGALGGMISAMRSGARAAAGAAARALIRRRGYGSRTFARAGTDTGCRTGRR